MTRQELISYINVRYSTEPEHPWMDDNVIFRHRDNRKWFAISMQVQYHRLGIKKDGLADVANIKCGPLLMGAYRGKPGILPGYHMNKDNWLTMLLDGSADDDLIKELLQISYDMTGRKTKAKRYRNDETSGPAF